MCFFFQEIKLNMNVIVCCISHISKLICYGCCSLSPGFLCTIREEDKLTLEKMKKKGNLGMIKQSKSASDITRGILDRKDDFG